MIHEDYTTRSNNRPIFVTGEIAKYLDNPYPEPHVFMITWEAFHRLKFIPNKFTWHLIVDEIPQAFDCFDEIIPHNHSLLTNYLQTCPAQENVYSQLLIQDHSEIRKIAENKSSDKVYSVFQPLAARLESKYWTSYVQTSSFARLCANNSDNQKLTVFSFLNPSIFDGFKSVLIAGAHFDDSILYQSFKKRGIKFHKSGIKLRYSIHQNGASVTFFYSINQPWSKRQRKSNNGELWNKLIEGVKQHFNDKKFVWSANKDIKDNNIFGPQYASLRLPHSPHGLNSFSDIDNVVFLSAYNLIPAHANFIQAHLNMSPEAIQTAIHRQQVYQAVMRCSLREPSNLNKKLIYVPDYPTASWLHLQFPEANLKCIDFGIEQNIAKRGRKRIHISLADRTDAYRKKIKDKLQAHIDALFSNTTDPSFSNIDFCNENTIKIRNNVKTNALMKLLDDYGKLCDENTITHQSLNKATFT